MSNNSQMIQAQFHEQIQRSSGFIITSGILLLLMGMFAMGSPLVVGVSLALVVGIMLIIGGISQLAFAFKAGKGIFAFVLGGLTIVIGGYMASQPGVALLSLTVFLAMYLIFSGAFEVMMAFQIRPVKGWGGVAFSGVLSMLLGLMIWKQFPLSGAWAIGIIIGVRLFFNGLTLVMLGVAVRKE